MLEQIDSDEIVEAPERIAGALARDLVARLARSPARPAEYANSIYGRRLRPLRDTVGRHSFGRGTYGDGLPPQEALNMVNRYANFDTTLRGRTELAPPVEAPEPVRAAAQGDSPRGPALLEQTATRARRLPAASSSRPICRVTTPSRYLGWCGEPAARGRTPGRADLLSRISAPGRARLAAGGEGSGADEHDRGRSEALRRGCFAQGLPSPRPSPEYGRG